MIHRLRWLSFSTPSTKIGLIWSNVKTHQTEKSSKDMSCHPRWEELASIKYFCPSQIQVTRSASNQAFIQPKLKTGSTFVRSTTKLAKLFLWKIKEPRTTRDRWWKKMTSWINWSFMTMYHSFGTTGISCIMLMRQRLRKFKTTWLTSKWLVILKQK